MTSPKNKNNIRFYFTHLLLPQITSLISFEDLKNLKSFLLGLFLFSVLK